MNEDLLATDEVVESVENSSVIEENLLENNTFEIVGDSSISSFSEVDTITIENYLSNIDKSLSTYLPILNDGLFVCSFLLLSLYLYVFIHCMTERHKV